ncbi:PE-PGRS family protein [Spirosoma utsteinense]|uniref:PE-PGRS family protein n=1 Tax=Spirosoma utsteinense TaxID=2585773 RepID=UPI0016485137|nr:PE-PGRS family protein [Spirosoma utsteinense]MBC3787771.1 hypothetical protein [Spirosoma utsteinense]
MRFNALILFMVAFAACQPSLNPAESTFATTPTAAAIAPGIIDEVSGLADSRTMPGNLWIEQDGRNPAVLTLLSHQGKIVGTMPLPQLTNRDWEDMTIGPGPQDGVSYLFLADIGDNNAQNDVNYVYRFAEPKSLSEAVGSVDRIAFRYPDGPRDAETLLIDPLTKDLWVVSKRETNVHLYRLPYPQSTTAVPVAQAMGELPLSLVVSGSISSDGREIVLKTYTGVYYWLRTGSESVADALQKRSARTLTYRIEPQGETICFAQDNRGFFTLSERASAGSVSLFYYAKQ